MKRIFLRILRQQIGVEIVRVRKNPSLMEFIDNRNINLILDVGANTGQFAQWIRRRGYVGRIISYEPVKEAFIELENAARGDDLWTTVNIAIGSSSGVMAINVSKNTQFSSFNDLTAGAKNFDPNADFKASENVVVKTLDEVMPPRSSRSNILLKIDTQGYERPVLEGAKEVLKNVSGVFLELPIINIYKNNWRFHEAVAYMNELSFVLAQVHPVNVIYNRARDSATEFDCLFRPVDPIIDVITESKQSAITESRQSAAQLDLAI
jgi:FkbM family methyltransferase